MATKAAQLVVALCLAGVLVAGYQAAAWSAPAKDPRRSLLVIAGGKAGHALGTDYCLTTGTDSGFDTDQCTSVDYDPTPHPRFRVASRSVVVACAGVPARRFEIALIRDRRKGPRRVASLPSRRLDRSGQCWRARLPKRLAKATSLGIRAVYSQADYADFVAGIAARP